MKQPDLLRLIALSISPRNPNGYKAHIVADDLDLSRSMVRSIIATHPHIFDVWHNQHIMMVKLHLSAYKLLGFNKPEALQY